LPERPGEFASPIEVKGSRQFPYKSLCLGDGASPGHAVAGQEVLPGFHDTGYQVVEYNTDKLDGIRAQDLLLQLPRIGI
jgi:hypothetical protein